MRIEPGKSSNPGCLLPLEALEALDPELGELYPRESISSVAPSILLGPAAAGCLQ